MGKSDHWVPGQNNVICDRCGGKFKSGDLLKTWDGLWVCKADWEPRHPQDFVKGVLDTQKALLDRPEAPDVFVPAAIALTVWPDV